VKLLDIKNLRVYFEAEGGIVKANDGVSLELGESEILGLIGETGCGKSILGRVVMRLLSEKARVEGRLLYKGQDLLTLPENKMRLFRGKEIGIMLQNPAQALNPVLTVGEQLAEIYRFHEGLREREAKEKARAMFKRVGIKPDRLGEYPHQFSGGMQQRVMLAIGLALKPSLLIADEPTKGLDPSTKHQIVALLSALVREEHSSLLLITHDLEVAATICDRIAVMYAGEILEAGPAKKILSSPGHPYTRNLLHSLPKYGLNVAVGQSPSLISPPLGCRFHPRCGSCLKKCSKIHPDLLKTGPRTYVRCHVYGKSGKADEIMKGAPEEMSEKTKNTAEVGRCHF